MAEGLVFWGGSRYRLQVVPKLAVPLGAEALALGERPQDYGQFRPRLGRSGLCLMIVNAGLEPLTLVEIGLEGRFGSPRISMHEPLFHDAGQRPRELGPGDSVVAYFASRLRHHEVLAQMRRAYVTTADGRVWSGTSPALRYFVRAFPNRRRRRSAVRFAG
jgi:hypothetical protein